MQRQLCTRTPDTESPPFSLASSHAPMTTDVPAVLPKSGGSIMIPMCASCLRLHLILFSHCQVI